MNEQSRMLEKILKVNGKSRRKSSYLCGSNEGGSAPERHLIFCLGLKLTEDFR